jgi:hypothetical protein
VPGCTFVHKGRVLCSGLSLAFLNVRDGDDIFAIARYRPQSAPASSAPRGLSGEAIDRLRRQFDARCAWRLRDPDAVFEEMRGAIDPVTARESARLADLFRIRAENSPAGLRREAVQRSRVAAASDPGCTVLPAKAAGPSTDQLPELSSGT